MYSIIIPHYNSPEKLVRLVDSIPKREDIEIVIVDDMSDSLYAERLEQNHDLNQRSIIHLSKKKLTAGGARNVGLIKASGKWVLFADSDDFFEPGAFEVLDREIASTGNRADVYYFKVQGFRELDLKPCNRGENINRILDNFGDFTRFEHVVPWGKMVRMSLLKEKKINFEEVRFSNDLMFSAKLAMSTKSVVLINEVLYHVEEGSGSLTKKKSEEHSYQRRVVQLRHEKFLFANLPPEFTKQRKYMYYRKYLRDEFRFGSERFSKLRLEYENAAGLTSRNWFRAKYGIFFYIKKRLSFPKSFE
jgi:glycosyltransferase involved in cell wall biosynthesis